MQPGVSILGVWKWDRSSWKDARERGLSRASVGVGLGAAHPLLRTVQRLLLVGPNSCLRTERTPGPVPPPGGLVPPPG